MSKKKNIVWEFFASVKLALFTFFVLAAASIIGTVIPQNEPYGSYVKHYGPTIAKLFRILDIPDMYNSWWFTALLAIFSLNLIVCSLERLPNVWRMVTLDNLAIDLGRLAKMTNRRSFRSQIAVGEATAEVEEVMKAAGWRLQRTEKDGGVLFFAQKGGWSRLGVYVVHCSILVIFLGAIIGTLFGYKASVMLPEKNFTDVVYQTGTNTVVPLGFRLRCDYFEVSYYDNGAPKDYMSTLTVIENGQEVLTRNIEVNDPLSYKGLTFYQSSYQGYDEFFLTVRKPDSGEEKTLQISSGRQAMWPEAGITLGIINYQAPNPWGEYRLKIWFSDGQGPASQFWLDSRNSAAVERPAGMYQLSSKQLFATGLQVAKDPGVWYVYSGCVLMLLGLTITFFMSHRRIWLYVKTEENSTVLLVSGSSNKNKVGFENQFEALTEKLQHSEKFRFNGEKS